MTAAILTAISRHYIDAYAVLVPFAVVTLAALSTASGAFHFLAVWAGVRCVMRTIRKAHEAA
ncbi:hypothetical protein K7H20_21960 [Salipiger manganoxidans]|uniref:hypothetical protein n=1 Tax=Salipiger marinus TaxID=555512 RepID=UPI001E2A730A|nr:hypothetical protein [Salipiger manganoxidans]MCD1620730.1 hypothetical protein [Salipiger manganoxidans]